MDRLLARAVTASDRQCGIEKRVHARVLLDDAGRVQAVVLRQGCGDSEIDQRALDELHGRSYPAPRLGSKTSRRWHNVVWTCKA